MADYIECLLVEEHEPDNRDLGRLSLPAIPRVGDTITLMDDDATPYDKLWTVSKVIWFGNKVQHYFDYFGVTLVLVAQPDDRV